jgi:hypothetical protein
VTRLLGSTFQRKVAASNRIDSCRAECAKRRQSARRHRHGPTPKGRLPGLNLQSGQHGAFSAPCAWVGERNRGKLKREVQKANKSLIGSISPALLALSADEVLTDLR